MNPRTAHDFLLPACLSLFPEKYDSPASRAMLIAIALQESDFIHRRQLIGNHRHWWQSINGPAVSFWQFERIGIRGVLDHHTTGDLIRIVLNKLGYPDDLGTIYKAIIHNDILAVCFARLLLWQLPQALPNRGQSALGYRQYLQAWKPGRPRPDRWQSRFETAWSIVEGEYP